MVGIKETEQTICEVFEVDSSNLYHGNGDMNTYNCRHFVEYILHEYGKVSYKKISEHTGLCTRGIMRSCANIKFLICHDEKYKSMFLTIKHKLKL